MAGALELLDIPLEGTHHRGVDDAKNIAKILSWILNG
jgi:inhibitor of KinA sporulation pathway (predicted exonuclease)